MTDITCRIGVLLSFCKFRALRCMRAASLAFAILSPLLVVDSAHAQGGSAVITLVMPVGARQLGMGETAVALADDVFGVFWNPAGLSFGPVAHEWDVVQTKEAALRREAIQAPGATSDLKFTTLATKPATLRRAWKQ